MALLSDDFTTFEWTQLIVNAGSGNAFQYAPSSGYGGGPCGYQPHIVDTNAGLQDRGLDPDGGYRLLPAGPVTRRSNGGLRMEWYWKHDENDGVSTRGPQMRAGLLNADLNGYTLAVNPSGQGGVGVNQTIRLEKRTGSQVDATMATQALAHPDSTYIATWLRSVLELNADGSFAGYVYTPAGVLLDSITATADLLGGSGFYVGRIPIGGGTFEVFDRVAAVGGMDWYIDNVELDYITP